MFKRTLAQHKATNTTSLRKLDDEETKSVTGGTVDAVKSYVHCGSPPVQDSWKWDPKTTGPGGTGGQDDYLNP
ncbi:MAG: hypothetical protein AAFR92_04205 [Pseudomonadota bacterium]